MKNEETPCIMKTTDGLCFVYGTPCEYKDKMNCRDYREHILPRERRLEEYHRREKEQQGK